VVTALLALLLLGTFQVLGVLDDVALPAQASISASSGDPSEARTSPPDSFAAVGATPASSPLPLVVVGTSSEHDDPGSRDGRLLPHDPRGPPDAPFHSRV
jgi:hypothetical protein